jgi:hypothetical protein
MNILDNSINESVVKTLRKWAIPEHPKSGYSVDGYEVPTPPDLFDFLKKLVAHTPGAQYRYLFGTPILHSANGVIFATVRGTDTLCLRLPGVSNWGRSYGDYGGEPWRQGSPWSSNIPEQDQFVSLLRTAYDAANVEPITE